MLHVHTVMLDRQEGIYEEHERLNVGPLPLVECEA
jgi:hypothetical protein